MAFTQPATFNEEWSDARVAAYMNVLPPDGENADFNILYHAYKHMRPLDFQRLLSLFVAAGKDVHAKNKEGLRFVDVIAKHPAQAAPFIDLINAL